MVLVNDYLEIIHKYYPFKIMHSEILQEKAGRLVLKLITPDQELVAKFAPNQPYVAARIVKDLYFLKTLRRFGLNVPGLVQTVTGQDFVRTDRHILYLLDFIAGRQPERTKSYYQNAGQLLGKLHQLRVEGYRYKTDFTLESSLDYIKDGLNHVKIWPDEFLARELNETLERLESKYRARQALIHTDFFSGNLVLSDEGRLYLVDFDDAGLGDPLLDLGYFIGNDLILEQDGEVSLAPDDLCDFLTNYCLERPLYPEEIGLLLNYIYFGVLIYISDYETGTIYRPKLVRYRWLAQHEAWLTTLLTSI